MEKEEVLSNLYGLRAGLSMISEQKDEICKNKDIYANDLSDCEDKMIDAFCDIYQARWGTIPVGSLEKGDDGNDFIAQMHSESKTPHFIQELSYNSTLVKDYDAETADIIKKSLENINNIDQTFKYSNNAAAKYVTKNDFNDLEYHGIYDNLRDSLFFYMRIYLEIINKGKIDPNHCEFYSQGYYSLYGNPWESADAHSCFGNEFAYFEIYNQSKFNNVADAKAASEKLESDSLNTASPYPEKLIDYTPYHKRRAKTIYRDQYMHYIESSDTQEQIDQYLAAQPQAPEKVKKTTSALKAGIPVAILIAAVLAVIAFFVTKSIFDGNILGYIAGIGGSIIIGAIILCIAMIKNKSNYKRKSKESAQATEKANANLESGKASIAKYLAARKKYIEVKNNRSEYYSQNIVPYKTVGDAVYSALVTEYSSMLDPRDWKWIDLIIYYFETGRADNIRDALLLVDKERQTQQIIASIKEASQNICTTLQDGFMMMQKTMVKCFNSLIHAIESGFSSLNSTMQKGFAMNNSLLAANLNATRLQNSLLAKSNETSQQLMEDVHYIRMNAM